MNGLSPSFEARSIWLLLPVLCLSSAFGCTQTPGDEIRFVATLIDVDAESRIIRAQAMALELGAPVASDANILDESGQPLAGGLASPRLAGGVAVTLTAVLWPRAGGAEIASLQIGKHVPEQRRKHGASVGMTPLTEFREGQTYADEEGGLYGDGRNAPPPEHRAAAEVAASGVAPLDEDGEPADNGLIGFVSISMSNATLEFSTFKRLADQDDLKSCRVVIVDCAQEDHAMSRWADPEGEPWAVADRRLAEAGVSPRQVQVAWIKLANAMPTGSFEEHGRKLHDDTLDVLRNAKARFPNLRIAYLSSRIFAGFAPAGPEPAGMLNPEPYAYETAFVVRRLIRGQMRSEGPLRHEGRAAPVPLLLWGPYLWADGEVPRSFDGLTWLRADFAEDGVHPSENGRRKVADLLLSFFKSDASATRWFSGDGPGGNC